MNSGNLAAWVEAIGTVVVAILAIWGDWFRARLAGPKLEVMLHDPAGALTWRSNGRATRYYNIRVTNSRSWSPADRVRVMVRKLERRRPDGAFSEEGLTTPVQLVWAYGFSKGRERFPTIATEDFCDLGFVDEGEAQFLVSCYDQPNNWRGHISANGALRVHLSVDAQNYTSRSALVLEVSWDGQWVPDGEEMQRHLVVKELPRAENS